MRINLKKKFVEKSDISVINGGRGGAGFNNNNYERHINLQHEATKRDNRSLLRHDGGGDSNAGDPTESNGQRSPSPKVQREEKDKKV